MDLIERENSDEDIKAFFKQWNVYRKVIEMNYMMHKEMFGLLLDILEYRSGIPVSVLDVGCGDAEIVSRALKVREVESYYGIDLSAPALNCAANNLKEIDCIKQFKEADFSKAIKQMDRTFDFIMAGFSLHHLSENEKEAFFQAARKLLKDDGCLVIYDLIRDNQESRDEYINRLCQNYKQEWSAMTHQEMEEIIAHITQNDYPETLGFYDNIAEKYHFTRYEMKYRDKGGFYGFCCFR